MHYGLRLRFASLKFTVQRLGFKVGGLRFSPEPFSALEWGNVVPNPTMVGFEGLAVCRWRVEVRGLVPRPEEVQQSHNYNRSFRIRFFKTYAIRCLKKPRLKDDRHRRPAK